MDELFCCLVWLVKGVGNFCCFFCIRFFPPKDKAHVSSSETGICVDVASRLGWGTNSGTSGFIIEWDKGATHLTVETIGGRAIVGGIATA